MTRDRFGIFAESIFRPVEVNDSRFGIRKPMNNLNESPTIFSYASPGKGPNGEHQN